MSGPSGPTRVGELVEGVLKQTGVHEQVRRQDVVGSWPEDVGPRIAEVAEAVRVDGRVLYVEVRSSAWLMELNLMKRSILERVNEGREEGRIESIRFFLREDGGRGGAQDEERGTET